MTIQPEIGMLFLADKSYQIRGVPPALRTVSSAPALLWLAAGAAIAAVGVMWVAMAI